jgi:hypothetical protein
LSPIVRLDGGRLDQLSADRRQLQQTPRSDRNVNALDDEVGRRISMYVPGVLALKTRFVGFTAIRAQPPKQVVALGLQYLDVFPGVS